jgi:hypothetical protein
MMETEQRQLPPAYASADDPAQRDVVQRQVAAMWQTRADVMQVAADETGSADSVRERTGDRTRHVPSV